MTHRLFDWAAQPCERLVTVASLRAGKGRFSRHAQVTADTTEEAAAAEAAGIEMVVCRAANVRAVRAGGPRLFITAALGFASEVAADDVLRVAIEALVQGADAVLCTRRLSVIEFLAAEDIPVMGHLGFVPRKSTLVGRIRAVGREESEARALRDRLRRLEEAGAFAVECELWAAPLLTDATPRSGLVTVSLGSGHGGDVQFLFMSDVCGDEGRRPRHARAWGDLASLRARLRHERISSLKGFRDAVADASFPGPNEIADADADVIEASRQPI